MRKLFIYATYTKLLHTKLYSLALRQIAFILLTRRRKKRHRYHWTEFRCKYYPKTPEFSVYLLVVTEMKGKLNDIWLFQNQLKVRRFMVCLFVWKVHGWDFKISPRFFWIQPAEQRWQHRYCRQFVGQFLKKQYYQCDIYLALPW